MPSNPYSGFPVYCKLDGQLLLSKRELVKTFFNEDNGRPMEQVRYMRYCADWQVNRIDHTEHTGRIEFEYTETGPK